MPRSLAITVACLAAVFSAADWRQFRGNDNNSATTAERLPLVWTEKKDDVAAKNVAWKAELPGKAVSSPIVVGGKVLVTADSGIRRDRLHVLCFDAASGQQDWERQYWATGRCFCHPTSAVAAPTPASDGQRVFAFYSSNDLACLDLEGNLQWYRGLSHDHPDAGNDVGMSSSPVVVADTVVVQIENQGDSFAMGLDALTGETRWRVERKRSANWVSPVVMRGPTPEGDVVVLQSSDRVTAHEPKTGEIVWSHEAACDIIASAAAVGDVVYLPSAGLTALRRSPGSQSLEKLWESGKLAPSRCSPIVQDGRLYVVNSAGVLTCGDAKTGESIWQLRLGGSYWSTPLIAGGHLYSVSQDGTARVVKLGDDAGEIVHEYEFGESILGSPAAADGALYFRSDKHLWRIAEDD
ncbi:MAG: PQQ-binding-like beta-propeller repeat protein [Pirellulales bacterium]